MRRILSAVLLLLGIAFWVPGWVSAADDVLLVINGKQISPDVPPTIHNQRTMVPVRVVAEGLDAIVEWDDQTRTATISKEDVSLKLQLENPVAILNGQAVELDAPPMIKNQRMLLPMRFVGEALGITVGWENSTRTVFVNPTHQILINGEDVTEKIKVYHVEGQLYIPVKAIADRIALKTEYQTEKETLLVDNFQQQFVITPGKPVSVIESGKNKILTTSAKKNTLNTTWVIDSSLVVPLEQLNTIINGKVEWDNEAKQIQIERIHQLQSITVDDGITVTVHTSEPIQPKDFTLSGPHRIVLDLPASKLSKEFIKKLNTTEITEETEEEEKTNLNEEQEQTEEKRPVSDIYLLPLPDLITEQAEEDKNQNVEKEDEEAQAEEVTVHDILDQLSMEQIIQQYPVIREIRFSQFEKSPYTVRIVLELNRKSDYQIIPVEDGFQIKLDPLPPKLGYLIVVDAGHGGKDPGARGVSGNVEKDFNLAVANRLVQLLKEYKEFQVMPTRTDDTFYTLDERAQLANDMDADLFISIHANAYKPTTRGTETYYYHKRSRELANVVHRHLLEATGFPDRKVQTAPFYVIKNTNMPSVLTETGFLTNSYENSMLIKPEFQEKVAQAIAKAIRDYYLNYN